MRPIDAFGTNISLAYRLNTGCPVLELLHNLTKDVHFGRAWCKWFSIGRAAIKIIYNGSIDFAAYEKSNYIHENVVVVDVAKEA